MATSGTVGQTSLDSATLIEHAIRRVRLLPQQQTPDVITLAQQNLYLLLLNLSNRGLNLWAIEKQLIGCEIGQSLYQCPVGTIDLLNLVYSQPTQVTGTDATSANGITTQLASSTKVVRVGIKLSAVVASDTLTLSSSPDGVSYTTAETLTKTDWAANTWYWIDLEPSATNVYFKAEFTTGPATFTEFYLATAIYDLPVSQWSRDTWSVINDKAKAGHPSTNYYFEKLLRPQVTMWPVPDVDYVHLTMFVHRQIQDVGTLMQTLEVPQRWVEAIVWQLAVRLAFELPSVEASLIQLLVQMSDKYTLEAEQEESDSAPLFITPGIGVYSR